VFCSVSSFHRRADAHRGSGSAVPRALEASQLHLNEQSTANTASGSHRCHDQSLADQSITLSATLSSDGGTASPSAFCVPSARARSNLEFVSLVGPSPGEQLEEAPRRRGQPPVYWPHEIGGFPLKLLALGTKFGVIQELHNQQKLGVLSQSGQDAKTLGIVKRSRVGDRRNSRGRSRALGDMAT
jgi:hypothetical protein